ncbi:hypothetical protein CHO01_17300 [Cellulomonas hominis]|uniref:N12 class adenine-specific DNA methylase/SAM-dependent methyltransferase n=1 Tax=Cellulomonas hominis TaxID=156981 RepID=A0A511FDD6_9CELL|nr:methyltransferase domain-containing protein [Cellulomonas hominis]MBB5474575.1 N12 class adenine-specific DNA methylase/SAM-dependent methyltransferase [Cellulomonas hominis]NKY05585.1 methyltransferase domain-containing protein [Cellulomonas hominis]GEL46614.1 hypothetical protein CHO01_17300 [Cellulomonas hominis]
MTLSLAADALRALHTLTRLDGPAQSWEREILAAWPGWGALAPAFATQPKGKWIQVADELENLLGDRTDWLAAGLQATDTSYYTPGWLIDGMLDVLTRVGFTGGDILEPGCGSGRFMGTGALPGARWTGIEADPVSAAIATALHPEATILAQRLEHTTLREASFDAAIGNVPFSGAAPFDPEVSAPNLHAYFILRALRAVRPGGYVIVATSRYLLDDARHTDAITELGELRGAVRLASGTFEATAAVADVLVLRRRGGQPVAGAWDDVKHRTGGPLRSGYRFGDGEVRGDNRLVVRNEAGDQGFNTPEVKVNRYWELHPTHVAGRMVATGFDRAPLNVLAQDPAASGAAALAAATADLPSLPPRPEAVDPFEGLVLADAQGRREGSLHLIDGAVFQVVDATLVPKDRPSAELRALIGLRDAIVTLLAADAEHTQARDSDPVAHLRVAALDAYTAYVTKYGPLNRGTLHEGALDPETGEPKFSWRRPPMGGFRRDPDYMTVMACEVYDPDTETAEAAPVLLRPVNRAPRPIERVESPAEAIAVCLGESGRIDLERVAGLLDLPADADPMAALGALAYLDPDTGRAVPARDYLSGNVRQKLARARTAAAREAVYARNITALERVVPEDFGPSRIRATLGAPWIAPQHVATFTQQVLGQRADVRYSAALALWEIEGKWWGKPEQALAWGTGRKTPFQILEATLNGRPLTVVDEVWDEHAKRYRSVRNPGETLAAEEKATAMQERFATWIWEDKARAEAVAAEFNGRFRSHVARVADGSAMTFPGLSPDISLWPWQRDAVDRILSAPRTAIGHAVGAGKTLSMVVSAMRLRQLGLATKPMLAVPGHLLEQIAREAMQAYPGGKFLIASKEDLAGDARRLFAARCATGDWDLVIVTHETLVSLPVDPRAEEDWVTEEKYALADAIRSDENRSSRGRTAKAIATAVKKLDARLAELRHQVADPAAVMFEHLGVDWLGVDEVHMFKRLSITARAEGFSFGASKRATDLLLKVRVLGQRRGDRPHFAGFSGTLFSNTLAEIYVWQKFFQPEALAAAGLESFDAWAAMFVRFVTAVEVAPDGSGFRMHRRPAEITNTRALMGMFTQVADLLPADALPLERPETHWHTEVAQMSGPQADFVAALATRADALRSKRPTAGTDNMLLICNDGRLVALDPALVGLEGPASKLDMVAARVAAIYHRDACRTYPGAERPGSLQLALCDLGTPGAKGSQTYGRIKAALIARGVPASQIRFVHEAGTDKARAALFAACRDGQVSVLIGSTGKVGVGTNIQTRMAALHHVDVPWRPADIEQREGRGRRPGNKAGRLDIYRYVTEGSFDAYMWQTNQTKAGFIHALLSASQDVDTVSDIGAAVLSYGEVKALASGNPLLLEHAQALADVRRLRTLHAIHAQHVGDLNRRARDLGERAERARAVGQSMEKVAETVASWTERPYFDPASEDASVASMLTQERPGHGRLSRSWRGLKVELGKSRVGAPRLLRIYLDYRELDEVRVPLRALRHDAVAAVRQALGQWLASTETFRADLALRVEDAREEARDLLAAAETARFEHEEELAAAEAHLTRVNNAMAEDAAEHLAAAA